MTGEPETSLREGVGTGRDNPVRISLFGITNVRCPERWDAGEGGLPVSYEVSDPNEQSRRGRILYVATRRAEREDHTAPPRETVIHTQLLDADARAHGNHDVAEGDRWDGRITEGIEGRERIGPDLCPIRVVVELWSRERDAPGELADWRSGWTSNPGEWLARGTDSTILDVIAQARWGRDFVIPEGDPMEPDKGKVTMDIRVRNVPDGTAVRLLVSRIRRIDRPDEDQPYDRTGAQPELQPGLVGAVVRSGRVVLGDGSAPEIVFLNYAEHWRHPGNNFYCFRVAFGEHGYWLPASERDHENHERDCLHLRYTVFIHRSSSDLPLYADAAERLHRFFRGETRHFRSFIMRGGPSSYADWWRHFRNRYLVIVLGHAGCTCSHEDHPQNSLGRNLQIYSEGFDPLGNCCPSHVRDDSETRAALADRETALRAKAAFSDWPAEDPILGGCGTRSHVWHAIMLGRVTETGGFGCLINRPGATERDQLYFWKWWDGDVDPLAQRIGEASPKFCLFSGGCRTTLTTNLGEHFCRNGTTYFSGWVYSPACDYGEFCYDLFTRWIQGPPGDPPEQEADPAGFRAAYQFAANRSNRSQYHPRLMDRFGVTTAHAAAASAEEALE